MDGLRRFPLCVLPVAFILMIFPAACSLPRPTCSPGELRMPVNLDPHNRTADPSLPAQLTWEAPEAACDFDFYELYVGRGSDQLYWDRSPRSRTAATELTWPERLQPGRTYFWGVSEALGPGVDSDPTATGPQAIGWFYAGSTCPPGTALTAPVLASPPDGGNVVSTSGLLLRWENSMTCLPAGYLIEISQLPNFASLIFGGGSIIGGPMNEFKAGGDWTAERFDDCQVYYWRVRAYLSSREQGPYSERGSFIWRATSAICPLGPFITPIPPTVPGSMIPMAAVAQPANCRSGPGMDYPVLDILPQGASLEVDGRNGAGTWWQVNDPAIEKDCWLAGNLVEINGDISQVPVVQAAPPPEQLPTVTPVPPVNCARYTDPSGCQNNQVCRWDWNDPQYPKGVCKIR